MSLTDKDAKDLYGIVRYGIAMAFGFMVASLEALRPGLEFQISFGTLLAFLLGAFSALAYWRVVWKAFAGGRRKSVLIWGSSLFLVFLGVGSFLYPLRYVQSEKLREIFPALAMVVLAASFWIFVLRRLHRYFSSDETHADNRQDGESER